MSQVTPFRLKLTPRQRELLCTYLWVHADDAYDDVEEHDDQPVEDTSDWWSMFDRLPEASWEQPVRWRRQMARAFDDLALDLEAGHLPHPRCVAEEVALLVSIATAQSMWMDNQYGEDIDALPETADDADWESATHALIGDPHLDWQLSPGEAPEWGYGVPPPETWFTTFDGFQPRPADRGFRR